MIRRLDRTAFDKEAWGSPHTAPWFENPEGRNIGEIWFAASEESPLLVKILFTRSKLSVQVHPDDAYARARHNCRGKTEMWHILQAEPGARIALGLNRTLTTDELVQSAETGHIERFLNWIPVSEGDTFFVPAGTIHAIGEGLVLCEVQQRSDVTYRLYDYGRQRELHLEDAARVSCCSQHEGGKCELPVACDYFRTDRIDVHGSARIPARPRDSIYVAVKGEGTIAGEPFRAGDAFEIAPDAAGAEIVSPNAAFLFTEAR